jgi:hypothetical protein
MTNTAFYVHRRLSGLIWRPYTAEEAKDPTIAEAGIDVVSDGEYRKSVNWG